jgi:hypothetical protein
MFEGRSDFCLSDRAFFYLRSEICVLFCRNTCSLHSINDEVIGVNAFGGLWAFVVAQPIGIGHGNAWAFLVAVEWQGQNAGWNVFQKKVGEESLRGFVGYSNGERFCALRGIGPGKHRVLARALRNEFFGKVCARLDVSATYFE